MDDLIKRADAIKAFCMDCKGQGEPCEHSDTCKTMKVLRSRKKIPAVEPKQGKWVRYMGDIWTCSACGESLMCDDIECNNFCPNCGARMK